MPLTANGAILLDLTRTVSRLGRGPLTGIDRVECAYLDHFLAADYPLFGLVRTPIGFLLLDHAGCAAISARVHLNEPLGKSDLIGGLFHRNSPLRARADADARRFSIGRAARPLLKRLLRHLPLGSVYFNVGHANLTMGCLTQIRHAGLGVVVMVHDTIPLDHPEFARLGTIAPFRQKLVAVARHADLVVHTTQDARTKTEHHFGHLGRVPRGVVANLGVPTPVANPAALPPGVNLLRPYFVAIGTIEPRKNYELLLNVWDQFGTGPDTPQLFIIGARGWASPELFARLDVLPADHPVKLMSNLPDAAVAALLQNAAGLLFPSHAEGFGLPVVEAAATGVPVITSNLAVIKELVGDYAVYLDATDVYSWMETIRQHAKDAMQPQNGQTEPRFCHQPPSWADHFRTVLRNI